MPEEATIEAGRPAKEMADRSAPQRGTGAANAFMSGDLAVEVFALLSSRELATVAVTCRQAAATARELREGPAAEAQTRRRCREALTHSLVDLHQECGDAGRLRQRVDAHVARFSDRPDLFAAGCEQGWLSAGDAAAAAKWWPTTGDESPAVCSRDLVNFTCGGTPGRISAEGRAELRRLADNRTYRAKLARVAGNWQSMPLEAR